MKSIGIFFGKMKGITKSPPRVSLKEILWSWAGAFLGISLVGLLHYRFFAPSDLVMLIGSFGASAVLVYGAIKSPLAQPRNLIGGHMISAFIGVATLKLLPDPLWLSSGIAVATAIAVMHATKTLHPPGGATALIAVTGGGAIKSLGFLYVFLPAGAGAIILLLVALIVNNIPKNRKYPEFWI
jgi:CBS-domain-containing membrane protein